MSETRQAEESTPVRRVVEDALWGPRMSTVAAAPCGTWCVVAVDRLVGDGSRYAADLIRIPLTGETTDRQVLTTGDWRDTAPSFDADGTLYFLSNRAGAGQQVYRYGDAEPAQVTDEPFGVQKFRVRHQRVVVLADAWPDVPHTEQRAYAARRASGATTSALSFTDTPVRFLSRWYTERRPTLVVYDTARADDTRRVLAADRALQDAHWDLSPDGTTVATTWSVMNTADRALDKPIALIDVSDGKRTLLSAPSGTVHAGLCWSPTGSAVAAARYRRTAAQYGPKTLWVVPTDGSKPRELTAKWDRWPAPMFFVDADTIVGWVEDDAQVLLVAVDATTGAHRPLTRRIGGAIVAASRVPGSSALVALIGSWQAPPSPVWLDTAAASPAPARALAVSRPIQSAGTLTKQRSPTSDVPCLVYRPPQALDGQRAVLWVHGGPVYAWTEGWQWRWHPLMLTSLGYTVVMPNPAGSLGYGAAWTNHVWGNVWGARAYDDVMDAARLVTDELGISRARTAVVGASFGGYMAAWIAGQTNDFGAIVSHAGIYALSSYWGATDVPAWWSLMWGHHPWEARDAFDTYSPARFVAGRTTPTLLTHGARDFRVPIGESLAQFEALKTLGVDAELVVYPDESHYLSRPPNLKDWYMRVGAFLERHIPHDDGRA